MCMNQYNLKNGPRVKFYTWWYTHYESPLQALAARFNFFQLIVLDSGILAGFSFVIQANVANLYGGQKRSILCQLASF